MSVKGRVLCPIEWNCPSSGRMGCSQSTGTVNTPVPVPMLSRISTACHLDFEKACIGAGSYRGPAPVQQNHSPRDASLANLYHLDWAATGGTDQLPLVSQLHQAPSPPPKTPQHSMQQIPTQVVSYQDNYQAQPAALPPQYVVPPNDVDCSEDEALTATPGAYGGRSPSETPFDPETYSRGIPAAGHAPRLCLDAAEWEASGPRRPATSLQRFKQALRRAQKEMDSNKENAGSNFQPGINMEDKNCYMPQRCTSSDTATPPDKCKVAEDLADREAMKLADTRLGGSLDRAEQQEIQEGSPPGKHFAWETLPDVAASADDDSRAPSRHDSLLPPLLATKPLRKWTVDDVRVWVASTPLPPQVADVLCENAINGPVLESLSDKDLLAMGIQKFGWRRQLLLSRKELCDRLGPKFFKIYSSTPSLVASDGGQSPEGLSTQFETDVPGKAKVSEQGALIVDPPPRVLTQPPLSHRESAPVVGPFGRQREFLSFAPCAPQSTTPCAPQSTTPLRGTSMSRTASPSAKNPRLGCTASPPRQHLGSTIHQIQHSRSMAPPCILSTPTHPMGPVIHTRALTRTSSPGPTHPMGPVRGTRRPTSQPRRSGSPGPALRSVSPGPALQSVRSPTMRRAQSPTGPPLWTTRLL